MFTLALQTVLLMAAAYFIGAGLACLIRRSLFGSRHQQAERRVDPLPQVMQGNAEPATFAPAAARPEAVVTVRPSAPAAETGPQDLKRIHLIDTNLEAALKQHGVSRYEHIANWKRSDVQRIGKAF